MGLFNKRIEKKWLTYGVARSSIVSYKFIVYLDNKFPDAFEQIAHYFENGLLDPKKTLVLFRFHLSSMRQIIQMCNKLHVDYYGVWRYADLPKLKDAHVYYPFNARSNCRICLDRSCKHIFIGHGESNKKASVPPINRIYDYTLISGNISGARLVENKIFRNSDIEDGRLIRFGDLMIQSIGNIHHDDTSEQSAICYAPTWEGGNKAENFSSLEGLFGAKLVIECAKKFNVKEIIIKFHPNTGRRAHQYIDYARETIRLLAANGLTIRFIANQDSHIFRKLLRKEMKIGNISALTEDCYPVKLGICDVSGFEAIFTSLKIPNLTVLRNKESMRAPDLYWKLRSNYLVIHGDEQDMHLKLEGFQLEKACQELEIYWSQLTCWQVPELAEMSLNKKREWLTNYIDSDPYW